MILVVLESEASSLHGWFTTFVRTKCLRVQAVTTSAKLFHAASLPEITQTTIKSSLFSEKCVRCYSDIAVLRCIFAWGCSHYSQSFYSK